MTYDDDNKGKVQFDDRFRQMLKFNDIKFKRITPTDIDACVEIHNLLFIFVEVKRDGVELPDGQKLCLERIVNAIDASGKDAIFIECTHSVYDTSKDIELKDTIVRRAYWKGKTHEAKKKVTFKEAWEQSTEWVRQKEYTNEKDNISGY